MLRGVDPDLEAAVSILPKSVVDGEFDVSGHGILLGSTLAAHWSLATALALLAWYVFAPQCASTLGVVKRETASWKWTAFLFGYMLTLAYIAALVTYHTAVALGGG